MAGAFVSPHGRSSWATHPLDCWQKALIGGRVLNVHSAIQRKGALGPGRIADKNLPYQTSRVSQ